MANQKREPFILDFPNGQRVEDILKKADADYSKAEIDTKMASKATMSDVQRETQNLQNQINEIVRAPESGGDVAAEVAQARVDADGVSHATLKARCDSDASKTTQLKEDLNKIATFDIYTNEIILDKSDCNDSYDSTYVNNGYINEFGVFSANNSYRTYYYQVTGNSEIAVETSQNEIYCSIAVFNGNISKSNFVARYRGGDGNLPTTTNRLSVSVGQWLAISYGYSSSEDRNFYLYTGEYNRITGDPKVTDEIAKSVADKIGYDYRTVSKTETSMIIKIGKLKYEFNKYVNPSIRADLWRTNACMILDNNGVYQTIWSDSDSDGVVKIKGESDFIGGYHGDETETLFHLFIDGVEYAEDSTFTDLYFNEIILYFESDVYHCNTSETPDVVSFKRNKIIKFNNDGYTVENYWTAQENLTCEISYIGMLSVENALINGYYTNHDFKYHALDGGVSRKADMTDVCFNTPYGDIGIKISEPIPNEHYGCAVSAYTGRLKVYASNFNSSEHGVLNTGDVIKGKTTIYFI